MSTAADWDISISMSLGEELPLDTEGVGGGGGGDPIITGLHMQLLLLLHERSGPSASGQALQCVQDPVNTIVQERPDFKISSVLLYANQKADQLAAEQSSNSKSQASYNWRPSHPQSVSLIDSQQNMSAGRAASTNPADFPWGQAGPCQVLRCGVCSLQGAEPRYSLNFAGKEESHLHIGASCHP